MLHPAKCKRPLVSAYVRILATLAVLAMQSLSVGAAERSVAARSTHSMSLSLSYARACRPADLLGTWRLVSFHSPYGFKDSRAPYLLAHQLFQYSNDGLMKSAHSAHPIADPPREIFDRIPSAMSYTLAAKGMVTVRNSATEAAIQAPRETWQCAAILRDAVRDKSAGGMVKQGDLVMTLIGKNGRTLFVRQLRKTPA
jgi:hypothetical protein